MCLVPYSTILPCLLHIIHVLVYVCVCVRACVRVRVDTQTQKLLSANIFKYARANNRCISVCGNIAIMICVIHLQGDDAALYGKITLKAEMTPLNFTTCNSFVLKPEQPCINPPRSKTVVKSYSTGTGARCAWDRISGQIASECQCEANAAPDSGGSCVCNLGYYGDGRHFCYPEKFPVWRNYYGELTGEQGPPARYAHGWVTVEDTMWLFGGYAVGENDKSTDANRTADNGTGNNGTGNNGAGNNSTVAAPDVKYMYMGDLHSFNTNLYSWKSYGEVFAFGGPPARAHHAMAAWEKLVFVHGGIATNDTVLGDFFMLDTYSPAEGVLTVWTSLTALKNPPAPRFGHSMAAVTKLDGNGALYLYGGATQLHGSVTGDLYEYDIADMVWTKVMYTGGPRARAYHA
jgi:hypothetical protein